MLALRSLGLSLEEIKRCLDENLMLMQVLERHLEAARERARVAEELRRRLEALISALADEQPASTDDLLRTM